MKISNTAIAIVSLIIVSGLVAVWYFLFRKSTNIPKSDSDNEINNLPSGTATSSTPSGTKQDASVEDAFNPAYWQRLNKAGTISMTKADAERSRTSSREIYNALGYFMINKPETIISVFTNSSSKAFVSMITQSFKNDFNKNLYDFLNTHLNDIQLQQVRSLIAQLPDY